VWAISSWFQRQRPACAEVARCSERPSPARISQGAPVTREWHRAVLRPGASLRREAIAHVCLVRPARATGARPGRAFVRCAPLVRAEAKSGSLRDFRTQGARSAQPCWRTKLGRRLASGRSHRSSFATGRQNRPSESRILHRFQGSHVGGWEALQLFALGRFNETDAGFIPRTSTIVNDSPLRPASRRNLGGATAIARTRRCPAAGQLGVRVSASRRLSGERDSLRSRCECRP
jgi:hypothetical protein